MPLTVLRDGAAPVILSNRTVFDQLPDEIDVAELMSSIRAGDTVPVTLREIGAVRLTSPGMVPTLDYNPPQQSLALSTAHPMPVDRPFELECRILVPIDAMINCHAPSKKEAMELANKVFDGVRQAPSSFQVVVNRDDIAEIFHDLENGMSRRRFDLIGAHNLVVNRTEER